jgi:excisionase family DNA binding protein
MEERLMETMTQERELTLAEVAAKLRVSVDTARDLLAKGDIPARKQGRQWRVSERDVDEYIRQSRERHKK